LQLFGNEEGGVKSEAKRDATDRLLTVGQVAELLGTTERFPRRLIAERRIEFIKLGRHVRIRESALAAYIDAGRVGPTTGADILRWTRGVA
jgi:excisionase family DNA binding protein